MTRPEPPPSGDSDAIRPAPRERHARLGRWFEHLRGLGGEALREGLARLEAEDGELAGEVRALLDVDGSKALLDAPAAPAEGDPRQIGKYRILGRLGQGGMGVVWLAQQEHPSRQVALKVLRPGSWRPESQARFEREAEVLARLNHPSIAHVFEAGTVEHRGERLPYLAMELVRGQSLIDWTSRCDLRGRLELLESVANAVQHAHDQGVIHRDLKPTNILVTEDGTPKVLDFGVARIERGEPGNSTAVTSTGELIGTLQYMAPEQVRGDRGAADERSDVYALGVLAYEALGGRRPYEVGHLPVHKAAALILEVEPTPLGRLNPKTEGDIETIVAKALEKDPRRRYPSAAAFRNDLQRHLDDLPIHARPATRAYRASKFVRRHRALVTGTLLVIAALSLGLAGMAWKAGQAGTLAAQSELRMERALEVTKLLTEFFDSVNPGLEGPDAKVADMIARWESVLDDAHRSPLVTAGLHAALSSAYKGIGDTDAAVRHQRDALRLREQHGAEAWELAESQLALGDLLRTQGGSDLGDTRELLVDAAASNAAAHGPSHPLTLAARASIALFDWSYGDRTHVLTDLRELLQRMLELEPPGSSPLVRMRNALAQTLLDAGELAEAERLYLASLQEVREQVGDLHLRTASARAPLVQLYREMNRGEDALEQALAIRAIHLDRLPPDHPDTAEGLNQLGAAYMAVGCGPEAIEALEEAVRIVRGLSPEPGRPLIELLLTLTSMQFDLGLVDEVSAVIAELAEIATPENGATLENRARVLETQGLLASWRSDLAGALAFQSRANALRRSDPGTSRPDLANSLFNEGTLLRRMGRFEESLEPLREAYRLELEIRGPEHPYAIQAAFDISIALRQLGRAEQALEPGRMAYEGFASALGPTHASTVSAARSLCEAHLQLGQVDAARPLLALYSEHSTEPAKGQQVRLLEARLALLEQRPAEALERLESVFERYRAEGRYAHPAGSAAAVSELMLGAYRALGDAEGEAAFEAELAAELADAAPLK